MAVVKKNGARFFLQLSEAEKKELGTTVSELQVLKAGSDLFILSGKNNDTKGAGSASSLKAQSRELVSDDEKARVEKIDEKIFLLLGEKKLKELVEGKFEKLLSKEENERLKELVKDEVVVKFRLSENYKKPVYRLSKKQKWEVRAGSENGFFCGVNGFSVAKGEWDARRLQEELRIALEQKLVMALKDFDNSYYFIDKSVFDRNSEMILGFLEEGKGKKAGLEELSKCLGLSKELVKGVCCFLKEEGFLIEKTKGNYELI